MKISLSGIALIKQFEGFTSTPKIDHKRVSIGYGNTFYPNGKAVQITDAPISLEQGEELLKHSLLYFERVVNRLVTATLTQPQFDALVSLCYNIGEGNFQRSTLLKMVNASPDNPNILSQFLEYNKASGKVSEGLTQRRRAEAKMYESGSKKKSLTIG